MGIFPFCGGVILSLGWIWRAAKVHSHGRCGGAREMLQHDAGLMDFFELSHYLNPAAFWEPINNKALPGEAERARSG